MSRIRVAAALTLLSACQRGEPDVTPTVVDPDTDTDTVDGTDHTLSMVSEELTNTSGILTAKDFGHFGHGRSCSVGDFDLDGLPDLVIGHPTDESFMLHNISTPGDVQFEMGPVFIDGAYSWTIQSSDYDNDGDLDLFFGMGGIEGTAANHLLRNDFVPTGKVAFVDVTDEAGVSGPLDKNGVPQEGATAGVMWLDFDLDGDDDLYMSEDVYPLKAYDRLQPDDWMGYDFIYVNNGDGTFTERGRDLGLNSQMPTRHSVWIDIENDGDMDVFENNYTQPSKLWRNLLKDTGELRFEDVTAEMSLGGGDLGMPLEVFVSGTEDFNGDGYHDLIKFVRGYPSGGPYLLGHVILLNVHGTGFIDATAVTNINNPFDPGLRNHNYLGVMGSLPGDFNGDGVADVYLGMGGPEGGNEPQIHFAEHMVDTDFGEYGTMKVPVFGNYSELINYPPEQDPDVLALGVEYPPYPFRAHGACAADFDLDGTIELFATMGGTYHWGGDASAEPDRMWRFRLSEPQDWLEIRPVGDGVHVSRSALGTRATVVVVDADGSERTLYGTFRGDNGFSSSNVWAIHMGLGVTDQIASVEVQWPDGEVTVRDDVEKNQVLVVER
ncbi:MAG: CRTAC1 family protein [Myxococcota bacterium]